MGIPGSPNPLLMRRAAAAADDGAYKIKNSVRFEYEDSSYLTRTPSVKGNTRTWTFSAWFKRLRLSGSGSQGPIFGMYTDGNNQVTTNIDPAGNLEFDIVVGGTEKRLRGPVSGFIKDPASWYHLVVNCDTTNSYSVDRMNVWLNGRHTPLATSDYPDQNWATLMSTTAAHHIGVNYPSGGRKINAYIADPQFIDGLALSPAAFAKISSGTWDPIAFALPAPNAGTTWSNTVSSNGVVTAGSEFRSGYPATRAFDGTRKTSTGAMAATQINASGKYMEFNFGTDGIDCSDLELNIDHNNQGPVYVNGINVVEQLANNNFSWQQVTGPCLRDGKLKTLKLGPDENSDGSALYLGGIRVNGVILTDGKTDPTDRTTLWPGKNDGTTWSSVFTTSGEAFGGSYPATNAFDGSTSTLAGHGSNSTSNQLHFAPASQFTGVTKLRFFKDYTSNQTEIRLKTDSTWGSWFDTPGTNGQVWVDISSEVSGGKVNGIDWRMKSGISNGIYICAIEINDCILVDASGDNSFHLDFADSSNNTAATLGKDSFNSNNWTPTNISVTAGTDNDVYVDSPTNYGTDGGLGGEVRGNYCTVNPLDKHANVDLEQGNLYVKREGAWKHARGTWGLAAGTGKWYFEAKSYDDSGTPHGVLGIATKDASFTESYGGSVPQIHAAYVNATSTGGMNIAGSWTGNVNFTAGNYIGVAVDTDAKTVRFYRNGVVDSAATDWDQDGPYFPWIGPHSTGWHLNFGQRAFQYTNAGTNRPSTDYKALCTQNLPDLFTGEQLNDPTAYFDGKMYKGTGANQDIKSYKFKPDLVWIKNNATIYHAVFDAVRAAAGNPYDLIKPDTWDAQVTSSSDLLTAFNSDGFTVGANASDAAVNSDGASYVSYGWDVADSSTTNDASSTGIGSIDSTYRANTAAGISIVSFTGTGSGETVAHGLGKVPDFVIIKNLDNQGEWIYYYNFVDGTMDSMSISSNSAKVDESISAPTSTVFSVSGDIDDGDTDDYIAYCFVSIPQFSKFGFYKGNGDGGDGTFVNLGFSPAWLHIKGVQQADGVLLDSFRDTWNVNDQSFHTRQPDGSATDISIDFLSNGFCNRASHSSQNSNDINYVYMAFAKYPQKTARAR